VYIVCDSGTKKTPWDHSKREGNLPGPGFPILAEVGITAWASTAVIRKRSNEQMQKKMCFVVAAISKIAIPKFP
jgi:uncharacterized DUF497 family protein